MPNEIFLIIFINVTLILGIGGYIRFNKWVDLDIESKSDLREGLKAAFWFIFAAFFFGGAWTGIKTWIHLYW